MQIKISKKLRQLGTALLISLVLASILCVSVTGYLSVAEHQNFLATRSQSWNIAIVVTEAGIEEGLQHLNSNGTANLVADGWTFDGTWYNHSNTLPSGDSYKVSITITNSAVPVLICNSTVATTTWLTRNESPFMFASGNTTMPSGSTKVRRAVQVKCYKGNLFTAALVAKHSIDLNGNGVYTDSYNSQDPAKSVNGKYNAAWYSGDRGDIATDGGIIDSVHVQNANIYGKVHTGVNCPVTVGSQGGVGTHAWQANNTGFEPNYVVQDANFTFPDTTMPDTTTYLTPTPGPFTNSTTVTTYTTNQVSNSSTYPNPVPWSGVTTNTSWATNASYPGPQVGMVTNAGSLTTVVCPSYPAAGTYVGPVTTNSQWIIKQNLPAAGCYWGQVSDAPKWDYWQYRYSYTPIANYAYPVITYNYANYTTNSYTTNAVYDYVLHADNKYVSSGLNGKKVYIEGANVTLAMPNGLTGNEVFTWNTGAALLVYSGGTSVSVAGNGGFNPNGNASSFIVYCAPTVTSFTLSGNGYFTGVLVAPNADLTLNGGGNNSDDFCGCLMVNSATMHGHFSFHWDESLGSLAGNGRFLITSWDEINPNNTP